MEPGELIKKQYADALPKYPKLIKLIKVGGGGVWRIDGAIDVIDDGGGYWDTYDVSIFILPGYPKDIPLLKETSKKIIRDANWHMSKEGFCCLATRAKIFHELANGITLVKWLDQFVHPFLANHVVKLKDGNYANKEFSHGAKGIIEGWELISGLRGSGNILKHLTEISGYRTQALNHPCFCGSGKKYKRCYEIRPNDHRYGIPCNEIRNDVIEIRKYLKLK